MSDDDWENQLDSDNEAEEQKKKEEELKAKTAAFADEDTVDPEEVAKKKKEEARKVQEEQMKNARSKQANKVDYDKIFEQRQQQMAGGAKATVTAETDQPGMSKAAKGIVLEKAAEQQLTDQLFGGSEETSKPVSLNAEKDYREFAKRVGESLYKGSAPYHIDKFFIELAKSLPDHCDSKKIKSISDHITQIYNAKLKKERAEDKNVKKKAPAVKGGGGKGYDRNNNAAMINDVMGAEDEEDYGQETGAFKREEEADYDFM